MPPTKRSGRKGPARGPTWAQMRKQLRTANKALASAMKAMEQARKALKQVENTIPGGGGNIVT